MAHIQQTRSTVVGSTFPASQLSTPPPDTVGPTINQAAGKHNTAGVQSQSRWRSQSHYSAADENNARAEGFPTWQNARTTTTTRPVIGEAGG